MEKNVKKKGRLKMALFTFSGGVHPADGKEFAKNSPITEYLPKGDVVLPLGQHIGAFVTLYTIPKRSPAINVITHNLIQSITRFLFIALTSFFYDSKWSWYCHSLDQWN